VPTILRLLINLQLPFGNLDISKIIRFALIGTAPLSYEEKNKFKDLFSINLYENYGLTETTFITCEPLKSSSSEDSQGVIFPGVQLNHELLRYEAEITVKSKYMFIGYLNRDGEIEQIDQEEYFRTGDIGVIKNNHLRLTGRVKDTIKKGGILINLGWIDRILRKELEFEFVSVQINHPILGEDYELLIVSEFSVQAHEIIWNVISKYLRKEIQPNSIKFVSKLDYTKSGKILRRFPLNNEVRDNHDLKFGK
jgi:acyl-CoA synthetase (AMP-forming)/AMP-acid ligase II